MGNGSVRRTGRLGSPSQRAMQTEIPCSAESSVERSDSAVVAQALVFALPFQGLTGGSILQTRRAPVRSLRPRHAPIAFRVRRRSSAYPAFEGSVPNGSK